MKKNSVLYYFLIIILNLFLLYTTIGIGNVILYFIYEYKFFKSEQFLEIKRSIESNTKECNELNSHIEDLRRAYIDFQKIDYGIANYSDNSFHNYSRPRLREISNLNNLYNCSLTVCRNAQQQPFKYICKYFNLPPSEETLNKFEKVLNDFSAAEQGKDLLLKERDTIVKSISDNIPFIIKTLRKNTLLKKLGFEKFDFKQIYFPTFIFQYISPGGYAGTSCTITMNIENLDKFVNYLGETVKFKKSIAGQRALMTSTLRTKIKERDHYTCQECGNSTEKEPNLLLEIDHIIPLSKNGLTTEDNLQTLCWKCNRKKGAKLSN